MKMVNVNGENTCKYLIKMYKKYTIIYTNVMGTQFVSCTETQLQKHIFCDSK